jgi:exosortase/archaeosortase family protein
LILKGEWLLLLGSTLVAGALYNHYMGHSALLIELIMVAAGCALAIYSARLLAVPEDENAHGLLVDILSRFMSKDRCRTVIPMLGFLLLFFWSTWKIVVNGATDLQMEDFIVTLLGMSLVVYYSGPSAFAEVKDFVVLYLMFLTIVFVVIWRTYYIVTGESHYEITAYAEHYFVTLPVVTLLDLLGFHVTAVLELDGIGLANIIEYVYDGRLLRLGIGVGCSGLYSAGLFFSAFLAFVLTRYRRLDANIGIGLGIGLLVTWASNIIRMTITIMTGIAYGHPALAFVHSYIGILIFIACITVFWLLIVRWLDKKEKMGPGQETPSATVA